MLLIPNNRYSPMKVFSSFHIPVHSPYAPSDYSSYVFPCTYLLRVFPLTFPFWKLRSATIYKLVYILGSSSVRILLVIVTFHLQYQSLLSSSFLPSSDSTLSGLSSVSFCVKACFTQSYSCLASELCSVVTLRPRLRNKEHSRIRGAAHELKPKFQTPPTPLSLPLQYEALRVTP